jgi:SAM-dependent methyltransferase
MTDPIFITSPVSVLTGDAARVALEATNDAAYYTPGKGVLSVPLERWQQAQQYERETWLTHGLGATEDRNTEHAAMFDDYKALPEKLGHVIELGCGAFTNLRHILPGRETGKIYLLDPLIMVYHNEHPNCLYNPNTDKFEVQFMRGDIRLIEGTIEAYDTDIKFDTVVIINTLSHCQDALSVFDWINAHLKKGGWLVFGEPARDIDVTQVYDQGHPLSYNQSVIDDFLAGYKEKHRNGNYFIGVKK